MSKLIKGCRAPSIRAVMFALFAMALAGCGGGGGDAPVVAQAAAPVATPAAVEVVATSCEITEDGGTCVADIVVRNVSGADVVTFACGGTSGGGTVTGAMDASRKTKVDLEAPKTCTVAVQGREKVTVTVTPTCKTPLIMREGRCVSNAKPAPVVCQAGYAPGYFGTCVEVWWAAARIAPMGEKVVGANQLPPGCNAWAQQCWKDAVANGTVKFVFTTATMVGYSDRPVVFAYVRNNTEMFGVKGMWALVPVYADDGTLVGSDVSGGSASEVDWVIGNPNGVIVHGSDNRCAEKYYYAVGFTWSSRPVACPD